MVEMHRLDTAFLHHCLHGFVHSYVLSGLVRNQYHVLNLAVVSSGRVGNLEKGRCSSTSNSVPHSWTRESLRMRNDWDLCFQLAPQHEQFLWEQTEPQPGITATSLALHGGGRRAICHPTTDTRSGFPWRRQLFTPEPGASSLAEASPPIQL